MKRDYITEIAAKRARALKRAPRWRELERRADRLIEMTEYLSKPPKSITFFKAEAIKYLPIGWVACIEGYSRLVFRDLIDSGGQFQQNAANFKELRVGIEHVVAMQSGKLTLGEFLAHLLPANGIADINSTMTTLLGNDFLQRIRNVKTDIFEPNSSLEDLDLSSGLLESVTTLFEWRHIYAHELASKARFPLQDVIHHSRGAFIFLAHFESVATESLAKAA